MQLPRAGREDYLSGLPYAIVLIKTWQCFSLKLKKEKKTRFKHLFLYKRTPQCIYSTSAYAKARMCGFVPDLLVSHIQIHLHVT